MKHQWITKVSSALLIVMLAVAALPVTPAYAAVGVAGQWAAGTVINTNTATSPQTGTYTVPAGSNRLLVVTVAVEYSAVTAHNVSATYGGQALTLINQVTTQRQTMWVGYLNEAGIAAAASTTLSVAFNTTNFSRITVHAATYTGVDQTTPVAGSANPTAANAGSLTFTNVPVTNQGYIFYVTNSNGGLATPPGGGAGYTEHFDFNTGNFFKSTASKAIVATGTETRTVNFAGGNDRQALVVVSLNPFIPTHTITVTTGAGGTVNPSGPSVVVNEGANQTFVIAPSVNNIVNDVLVDGVSQGRLNTYTFTNVTAPHTIAASFDSGWYAPSANVNGGGGAAFTNPGNIYTSNDVYATGGNADTVTYNTFGIPAIPLGAVINGIEVALEGNDNGRTVAVDLSGNGGGTFAPTALTANFTGTDSTLVLGGPSNLWGGAWTNASFTNANFRVRLTSSGGGGGANVNIDQLQVKVYYTNIVTPTLSITNSPVIYNGAPQAATVTCSSGGAVSNILYAGSPTIPTNAGTYAVTANCAAMPGFSALTNASAGNFVINPATPTASITNSPVIYNGLVQTATVACLGGGTATLASGGTGTNAGSYPATVNCAASVNYTAATGLAAGNFVINPATPTASITNSPVTYNGLVQTATVACLGGGTATLASGGTGTDVGSYPATVDCAASANYAAATGLAAGNFVIDSGTPTASITNSPVTYNGLVQTATVACSGGGAATLASGGTGTNAGSYPATVDCAASVNYVAAAGLAAGNFVIDPAPQTINVTMNAPANASNGSTFDVAATATSGLQVTITTSGSCSGGDTDGTATITMTSGSGTCTVSYNQAGDSNYAAAPQVQENVNATEGPSFTSANSTSFDMGFPGSFTVTAVGNPSTMTIVSAGALPSGVTLTDNGDGTASLAGTPAAGTNGTYNLIFTADNGVAPNGLQNFTLIVRNGPIVAPNGVNSVPDTGNGSVSENESIIDTLGITQLTVEFSQDVYDPAGDTDPDDVTNPANYVLVRSATGTFATVSCAGGPVAPDITISVDSVTYDNGGGSGPFISTLSINGGLPLNVVGFYRLYVCGTTSIVDAANPNLILAGNGTTPGTDFQRNFRIATQVAAGGAASASQSLVTSNFLIPVTGFAPNQVTTLPAQPADKVYTSMGQMTIEIPTLGIKFPIVGASITNKTWDLTWLKSSVAYLEGSAYPTTAGNTVLTAHVQDANKNLGPFSDIKGLQAGQYIYIHVNGQTYVYQVQESRKVLPNNISAMFKHEEDSWITLVTCEDYNAKTGLYSSRRMVRAVLISVIPAKK